LILPVFSDLSFEKSFSFFLSTLWIVAITLVLQAAVNTDTSANNNKCSNNAND